MPRPILEVADVFRRHGAVWRAANEGHLSLAQRRVVTAIEVCRTAALGGHVERCEDCAHTRIAYNSCRNRHCPKCQWTAAQAWLEAREAELLPVPYFHVVFTLPAQIGAIAYQNKAKVYGLLFSAAAETLTTIAADPKHLGANKVPIILLVVVNVHFVFAALVIQELIEIPRAHVECCKHRVPKNLRLPLGEPQFRISDHEKFIENMLVEIFDKLFSRHHLFPGRAVQNAGKE
jgi:hypothetical protein